MWNTLSRLSPGLISSPHGRRRQKAWRWGFWLQGRSRQGPVAASGLEARRLSGIRCMTFDPLNFCSANCGRVRGSLRSSRTATRFLCSPISACIHRISPSESPTAQVCGISRCATITTSTGRSFTTLSRRVCRIMSNMWSSSGLTWTRSPKTLNRAPKIRENPGTVYRLSDDGGFRIPGTVYRLPDNGLCRSTVRG